MHNKIVFRVNEARDISTLGKLTFKEKEKKRFVLLYMDMYIKEFIQG